MTGYIYVCYAWQINFLLEERLREKVVCYNTHLPTTSLPRFTGKVREQRVSVFPSCQLLFRGLLVRNVNYNISVAFVRSQNYY